METKVCVELSIRNRIWRKKLIGEVITKYFYNYIFVKNNDAAFNFNSCSLLVLTEASYVCFNLSSLNLEKMYALL